MKQDDMEKNVVKKVTIKTPIPGVNEYPIKEAERWAKRAYHQTRVKVHWRKAKKFKELLPIETAAYAEKMTFGKWRLTGPGQGQAKSPLDTALEYLNPYIKKSNWGQFKPKFISQLTQSFSYICNSEYAPTIVKEMNDSINQLLKEFTLKEYDLHLEFVLHPETVEYYYNSPRLFEIKSRIWKQYAGKELARSMHLQTSPPGPNSPRQMDMHLDLEIRGDSR